MKDRRKKQVVLRINKEDGVECCTTHDIESEAIQFFQTLFSAAPTTSSDAMLQYIPHVISEEENSRLLSLPELQEVKQAVWYLSPTSAAGPDGFPGSFY